MRIQHILHSRSVIEAYTDGGGGLGQSTIIFIVLGVVCFLVILIGFYFVGRRRAACNAVSNVSNVHSPNSPIAPLPRSRHKRDVSEHLKIWRTWRHAGSTAPKDTADLPTSHLSPSSVAIAMPPRIIPARSGSHSSSPVASRPSHSRRVTSLSVATSFSHSHITEEALSDLCASAYDLDGDLETEMLHSARDDVWPGHPLAVEDGYVDVMKGGMELRGNVTPIIEGSAEEDEATRPATQWKGTDYENSGACQGVARERDRTQDGVSEVDKVAVG